MENSPFSGDTNPNFTSSFPTTNPDSLNKDYIHYLENFLLSDVQNDDDLQPLVQEINDGIFPDARIPMHVEKSEEEEDVERIYVFVTKSETEIINDGFKWKKYGKKDVKSNPNPRNYYKCAVGGCTVKKRIEKDKEDPSYVITTYHGNHNHVSHPTAYN